MEQANAVAQMAVFARVEPSHKQRLVELLKAQASSQLPWVFSISGCSQRLTVETLLHARVPCGVHGDQPMPSAGMNAVPALSLRDICHDT